MKTLPQLLKNYSESTTTNDSFDYTTTEHTLNQNRGTVTLMTPPNFDWDRVQVESLSLIGSADHPPKSHPLG